MKHFCEQNYVVLRRAETQQYAFFMESTSLEYWKERHCDLLQVGGLLDSKSYGIGMKKSKNLIISFESTSLIHKVDIKMCSNFVESPFKKYIDDALLHLKENGEIEKLRNIWWKEKRGGGKCGVSETLWLSRIPEFGLMRN